MRISDNPKAYSQKVKTDRLIWASSNKYMFYPDQTKIKVSRKKGYVLIKKKFEGSVISSEISRVSSNQNIFNDQVRTCLIGKGELL